MKSYNIAQFGAFDVNSYGDSLFPDVLERGIKDKVDINSITLFSPTAVDNGYNGHTVHSFAEFRELQNDLHFDCIIIGGGELFHFQPISFKNTKGEEKYEEGALWIKPLKWSIEFDIPVIINAVGAPYSFSDEQKKTISELIKNVRYFSVRDEYSYNRLRGIISDSILKVVPDTVWKINDVYTSDALRNSYSNVCIRYQFDSDKPYIIVQYGTSSQFDALIEQLLRMKEEQQWQIIVMPINYSHEDVDIVTKMRDKCKDEFVYIDGILQPIEIAALISNASAFIGTSLHGNLTAMRYGVMNVAIDMYSTFASKIDGLFARFDSEDQVLLRVDQLAGMINNLRAEWDKKDVQSVLNNIDKGLEEHFEYMAAVIQENKNESQQELPCDQELQYRKMYIKYTDESGMRHIARSIAASEDEHYVFEVAPVEEVAAEIELGIEIAKPTYIDIEQCKADGDCSNADVEECSANLEHVYMEQLVRFKCNNVLTGRFFVHCSIQDRESTEFEHKYFEILNDRQMHIDQLIVGEREKESEIVKKEVEKEKAINALEKQKDAEIFSKQQEISRKSKELEQKNITINNQRGHIEQLLEVDRHYQNIVRSKGWRLVSFPGRVFEKLYPVGTPRRRRISNVVKYVKAVNITNIKFVANAFRKGGMKQVRKEMNAFKYRCNNELPSVEPQIWEVDEITDLSQCDKLVFKKWDAPKVSIVIPVYNQFTYTYNCLKSILENSGDVSYEIIIADDVSNDLTTRLSEVAENIQIARNKENQRFLRNCNQAAKYAKGEYILFLNNDTQVQENWLQPLVELIERDDSIGMVGSKLIYPDGSLQEAGGIIWGDGHAWNYGNGQNANKPEFNYVKEVDYISGAAIMIRTSLWKEIGGFDELFAPAYCEDSDLAFEVRKHGYKLMYQPTSVVVHFEGKSNGTDLNAGVKSYQVENSKKLAEKWKEEFARQSQTEDDLFHARERSQNKKTILVIDHYVPQFDKDAGSKTTWQYLKMFVKQGYNVKFMGDNFFQDEEYTPVLEQYGIEVLYGPWYAENYKQWIIDNQDNIDFAYLNRPHITEKYIDFIKNETNIKCIYYGHDLHFLRIFREYELCKDEALLQESEDWKRREFAIMKQADINYYPSYVEVDEIHKVDSSIPAKAITAYVYEKFRDDISLDFAQKNGILFVGGFGHPPNEDAVLWFAKEVYPLITKKQDIPFYIVGSNATDAVKRLNSKNIIVKGFVTEEELKELYDTCKLVVVPLRYGAGVKGKVVEALYYGTPMVTTTVGIEGIKGAEEFMEVADEPEKFAQKVLTLYNDNDRLVKTVEDYQKYIKAHNSIDAVWDIVKEDFQ